MEQRLKHKVAIVTGAGQGIGKGIALRLAREGARVIAADYNTETSVATAEEINAEDREALAYTVNIAEPSETQKMVDEVVSRYGHIDILINNAGVIQTRPMMEVTPADWDYVLNVNQRGMFFCLQAVAAQMIHQIPEEIRSTVGLADVVAMKNTPTHSNASAHNYGKIVNLSSIAGRRGRSLQTHYAASKASVISITQSAAMALAPYNITVNAVCPGIVPTPMWQQIDKERTRLFGAQPGEAMTTFINTVPLRRPATPEDIAGAVAFFCSKDANYITGQALNVDGGYEMN